MVGKRVHILADQISRILVLQEPDARRIAKDAVPLQIDRVDGLRRGIQ